MSKLILLNKPYHVLSQFKDDKERETLKKYLPNHPGFYPAGRLDYDSEGLIILTDSGSLQHQISHPKHKQSKTYWVQVEGDIQPEDLIPLQKGVQLNDGPCRPAAVKIIEQPRLWERSPPVRERKSIPTSWIEISISEGRNRQVRRMTAAINYPTLRLIRASIGDWKLNEMQPGEYQEIAVHAPKRVTKPTNSTHKHKNTRQQHTTRRKRPL